MSFHRVTLVALATLFTVGMTSLASACCDFGYSAPVVYAPVGYGGYGGGGGGGCGGCGAPTAAAVYAVPVAPAPIAVSTVVAPFGGPCCNYNGCGNCGMGAGCGNCGGWGGGAAWSGGCGGCGGGGWSGGCGSCGNSVAYAAPYVVNQGPVYSGPGLSVPYATYSPEASYAPATDYPYVPGYGYGQPAYPNYYARSYYRQRYAFHSPVYMHPRYYGGPARYSGRPAYYGRRPYGYGRWHG
jgi:hypothetical protein